jgi:hypothetical protein
VTEPRTTDPVPPTDLWEDDAWEELLAAIGEQQVVPIVGRDLVIVELDGVRETLESYITRALIRQLPWPGGRPEAGATLNDVASTFIRSSPDPERQRKTISKEIIRLLQETDFPAPEPLRKLAEITPLRLFVNLTFDSLLEQTLQQVRYGGRNDADEKDQGVVSCIYKSNFVADIGLTPQEMQQTRVYNLFGRVSPSAPYVLTDEDLLEHIRYFQVESTRPKNLFDELNRSNLLLLGEGYSDWLARFFIRSTKSTPLSWQRPVREFMADGSTGQDAGLVSFLRRFSRATQVSPKGAVEFVDELHERWTRSAKPTPTTRQWREPPPGAVFLSYTRPDIAAVRSLKQALEAQGVSAWFDADQLEAGDPWLEKVEEYIRRQAILFVPVLSDATESRPQGKFRREWLCALERNKDHTGSPLPFLVPVGLKKTSFRCVPPEFRAADIKEHDGGAGTERFVARIAELVAGWHELLGQGK